MDLAAADGERVAALARAGAAADVLELALLRLWGRLQHREQRLAVSSAGAVWGRLARLLFAADDGVQRAAAAVAHAAALQSSSSSSLGELLWCCRPWWQRVLEKLDDCSGADATVEIGEHLLLAVGALLRACASDASARSACDDERAAEALHVLTRFSASPSRRLALCATTQLTELLRHASASTLQLLASSDSDGGHTIAAELLLSSERERDDVERSRAATYADEGETLALQCARFALLRVLEQQPVDSADGAARSRVDVLALGSRFLSHRHPALQEHALRLLRAAVRRQRACASIRLSGLLISVCWLLGHARVAVAAAAGELLRAVVEASPATDVLRALVEQGCAVVLSAVDAHDDCESRGGWRAAQALRWMAAELRREPRVLRAAASCVWRSSNVLLQKNVLLSLLLLTRSDPELQRTLQQPSADEDGEWPDAGFLDGVVHTAVDANEDGALAAMLLSAALGWCDTSSALKLQDGSFRQSTSLRHLRSGLQQPGDALGHHFVAPPVVSVACGQAPAVAVDGKLLYTHSAVARRQIDAFATTQQQQQLRPVLRDSEEEEAPPAPVLLVRFDGRFDASTLELFVATLAQSQQEAAVALRRTPAAALQELLALAKATECAKCWHFATFALTRALDAATCGDAFAFAVRSRHPSLMMRAGRVALDAAASGAAREVAQLQAAALALFRELFGAPEL